MNDKEYEPPLDPEVVKYSNDFTNITRRSTIEEVIDADAEIMNAAVNSLIACLQDRPSFSRVIKTIPLITQTVISRRQLLLMPSNASENRKSTGISYDPLD